MFDTEERTARHVEAPSRRLEEIRELEAIWSVSERETAVEVRPTFLGVLHSYRVSLAFAAVWVGFLAVLLALAPATDPLATPEWARNAAGLLVTALMLAPLGIINRALGYGASTVAAGCGMALAVSCFGAGHTGFWPSYQLAGFGLLALAGGAMLVRTARS